METIMLYIIIALIIMGDGTYTIGANLTKRPGWLYLLNGICGILIGLSLGYLRSDIFSGLPIGLIIALLYIFSGAMSRWQKQKFTELERWHKKRSKK